jgi:hypothetical protein
MADQKENQSQWKLGQPVEACRELAAPMAAREEKRVSSMAVEAGAPKRKSARSCRPLWLPRMRLERSRWREMLERPL